MVKKIFIELEAIAKTNSDYNGDFNIINHDETLKEILGYLSDSYDVVVFSCVREIHRLLITDYLIENDIRCDDLFLRRDNDYTKSNELRLEFIVDEFKGDEEKAVDGTLFVCCNNERAVEDLRERGFKVFQTDWG
jgi:hypothetical protein